MESREPTLEDLEAMRGLYKKAKAAVPLITCENGFDREYPREVSDLDTYIGESPWVHYEYSSFPWKKIQKDCSAATMEELRSVITAFSRGERFCSGFQESALKDGWLDEVLQRAEEIIQSGETF